MSELKKHPFDQAVICAGASKALARIMITQEPNAADSVSIHGMQMAAPDIFELTQVIQAQASPETFLARWPFLDPERAQVLLVGAMILTELTRSLEIEHWLLSTFGLREGIILDALTRLVPSPHLHWHWDRTQDAADLHIRWARVVGLGERYQIDSSQAERVSASALELYDCICQAIPNLAPTHAAEHGAAELTSVVPTSQILSLQSTSAEQNLRSSAHQANLGVSDRDLLRAAAWLHEVGKFIAWHSYHRHSEYLINYSSLLGFSDRERATIALITRYHRRGKVSKKKALALSPMDTEQQRRLSLLVVILAINVIVHRSRQDGDLHSWKVETDHNQAFQLRLHSVASLPRAQSGRSFPAVDQPRLRKHIASLGKILQHPTLRLIFNANG